MSCGFDISFNDLESGSGFDFLARQDGAEIEVECKHVSADIGRQIHRRKIYNLGCQLYPILSGGLDGSHIGRLFQVTLPGRLHGNRNQHDAIVNCVARALSGDCGGNDSVCSIAVQEFEIGGSIFGSERGSELSIDEVGEYVRATFGLKEAHMFANRRPGHAAIIVYFASKKPDRVLDEIFKRLKDDARRQFSGKRPAFMCVHLADLAHEQLLELANADRDGSGTGIQRAITILLHRRVHLHGVALMTDGDVQIGEGGRRNRFVRETGPSYVFSNPSHPDAGNPILERLFR